MGPGGETGIHAALKMLSTYNVGVGSSPTQATGIERRSGD